MENNSNKNWSDLPVHKPDADLWNRIDTELDLQAVSANIDNLPQYSPKMGLWKSISLKLFVYQYIKYIYFAGAGLVTAMVFLIVFSKNAQNDHLTNKQADITNANLIAVNSNEELPHRNAINEKNKNINQENNKTTIQTEKLNKNTESANAEKANHAYDVNKMIYSEEEVKNTDKMSEVVTEFYKADSKQKADNVANLAKSDNKDLLTITNATDKKEAVNEKAVFAKNQSIEQKEEKQEDSKAVEPKKVNLKSVNNSSGSSFSTIGIDYSILKINNAKSFSNSYNDLLHQYGLSFKHNFAAYFLQSGLSVSGFSDVQNSNVLLQKDQITKYNYVDSVLYNQQGQIIQYITHPVVFNDSVLYQSNVAVRKSYTLVNIPVLAGYQWSIARFDIAVKSGLMCTMVISGKETMDLPLTADIKVIKAEAYRSSLNSLSWAAVFSSSISYNFSRQWAIGIEPVIYYYFKPMYNNMEIYPDYANKSPWIFGLKSCLYYKF